MPFRELAASLIAKGYDKRAIQSRKPATGMVGSPPGISTEAKRAGESKA